MPLSDVGPPGEISISIAVILSSIGALNGWTLLMGQVPMAAAQDGLFPPLFGSCRRTVCRQPESSFRPSWRPLLVLVQAVGSEGFAAFYNLVVGLSTMAAVIPYAFCALAVRLVSAPRQRRRPCHG